MIFADTATITVRAGRGGDGMVSFRREPYVSHGGPDGGDGGNGGDVIFVADRNLNSLANFRWRQELAAEDGVKGARARRHGKSGADLFVKMPVGTVVYAEGKEKIADLDTEGQQAIIAKGGEGGFGNAHFTSSTRQAPNFAEKGEDGDEFELTLELKLIADVGLVGLPNAGKSTLLSVVSNARPEIADYPFTTLTPNLGVADIDGDSLLIADIPGLIEGASEGKGLGDDFLRHVERTATLIHCIDAYSNDITADYKTIMSELSSYKVDLSSRPIIIALTKTENIDKDIIELQLSELKNVAGDEPVHIISSHSKEGLKDLLRSALRQVKEYREREFDESPTQATTIRHTSDNDPWTILEQKDGSFRIKGKKIERFARRTDFSNEQGIQRLRDIMKKMGIERELLRRGVDPGTRLHFSKDEQNMSISF